MIAFVKAYITIKFIDTLIFISKVIIIIAGTCEQLISIVKRFFALYEIDIMSEYKTFKIG